MSFNSRGAPFVVAAMVYAALPAHAQTRLNFVSCPMVRDTPTVPCWLTEYEGEVYYLGIQTDVSAEFHPPQLGHRVLVEATVADDADRICGGIVLEPVKISVMPELDGSCDTILPVDPRYTIDFNPRPPGPSGGRLAFDRAPDVAPPAPERAEGPRTFHLYFDVDQGILFRHPADLLEIVQYAKAVDARRIVVRGTRGSTLLTNGELVTEAQDIAARRAHQVAELLRGVQIPGDVRVEYSSEPSPADGVDDWMSRSVEVLVQP